MLEAFHHFIKEKKLIGAGEKTLIAASAGVDSTVLCHLFHRAGLFFEIAHCNFQLRGEASNEDEYFVKKLAESLGVRFHAIGFATESFATEKKISIQEAARELRYDWLENIRQAAGCQYIATAHHLDDSIETVLFNFTKGCGIRGLHGILPKNGQLIRPLLFATKQTVIDFAQQQNIEFREDASNFSVKYTRNKIRHEVIPVLQQINPGFQKSAGETIQRLREVEALYSFAIENIKAEVFSTTASGYNIDIQKLRSSPAPSTVLYELISPFGFNNDQANQILQSLENQSGKIFESSSHRLLVDRFFLILSKAENVGGVNNISIILPGEIALPEGKLTLRLETTPPPQFTHEPNAAWLDYDRLSFPLTLRRWQAGDVFQPLGMGGKHQKLQDFFINHKMSRFEKEKTWLLESGGKIAWVVGLRLDERFKVSERTKSYLVAYFEPDNFAH